MLAATSAEGSSRPLRPFLNRMEHTIRSGSRMLDASSCVEDLLDETLGDLERPSSEDLTEETGALLEHVVHVLVTNWHSVTTLQSLATCLRGLCDLLQSAGGHLWEDFPLDAECLTRLSQHVIPALCDNDLTMKRFPRNPLCCSPVRKFRSNVSPLRPTLSQGLQILGTLETDCSDLTECIFSILQKTRFLEPQYRTHCSLIIYATNSVCQIITGVTCWRPTLFIAFGRCP
jgi:hypothetical protein